jgi:D-alanine-D-alanine ligase
MGGASAEAEVSRTSAAQVAGALANRGHSTHTIELDSNCAQALLDLRPDVVFPALHGPPGEDGTVQGFVEMLGLPYVGSDVRGSALAMDKAVAKHIFRHHGLPVTDDVVVQANTQDLEEAARSIQQRLGSAVAIKPLNQGSAIGVTPLPNGGDIAAALQTALGYGSCLVEPYIMGKEITVGVLEVEDHLVAHPVIEIVTASEQWYDYENRYTPGQSEHIMPANLEASLRKQLQSIAIQAHEALGLQDLSRADFIVTDSDDIALLEVNTLPGMTPTSLYPEGASAIGYPFEVLVDHLVQRAVERGPRLEVPAADPD